LIAKNRKDKGAHSKMNHTELTNAINDLRNELDILQSTPGFDGPTYLRKHQELCAMYTQLQCLYRPELKGQVCALCEGTYDGYGNNGYPLTEERVCDECNADKVIPARMGY
jgi:hypothetical protein